MTHHGVLGSCLIDSMKEQLFQVTGIRQTKPKSHGINSLKHSLESNRISHNAIVQVFVAKPNRASHNKAV